MRKGLPFTESNHEGRAAIVADGRALLFLLCLLKLLPFKVGPDSFEDMDEVVYSSKGKILPPLCNCKRH